ncbi:MAG: cache domain-containing protein, partial [Candidatus Anammoxibacter sp.]
MFKHVDKKILYGFLTLAIVPLCIAMFVTYRTGVKTVRNQAFNHASSAATSLKDHVFTLIKSQKNIARNFSSDLNFIASLKALQLENADSTEIIKGLNRHIVINKMPLYSPDILDVRILDHKGTAIASTIEERIGADESDNDFFVMTKRSGYFGDLYYSPLFFEPVFEVSAPIVDIGTNDLLGVVVNTVSGSILNNITIKKLRKNADTVSNYYYGGVQNNAKTDVVLRKTGIEEVYIVNRDKLMITESTFVPGSTLNLTVDTEPVRRALVYGESMVGVYNDYRNISIIGASAFIDELKWVVLAEDNIDYIFKPLFKLKAQMITFCIITFGIILFVS